MIKKFEKFEDKPTLKCEIETVYTVDYRDLEEFVKNIYGGDYEFVAVQECSNDTDHKFTVDGKMCLSSSEKLNEYKRKDAEKIRSGQYPNYCNNLLLDCLVVDGYIQPGTYLIQVSW